MELISCYIENFGKLSQYNLKFSKGLTVIKEANGFGKSTLAAFIRIMFYGMPRGGKSIEKKDRKRYKPWQGGKFGGNLTFESNGIQYRIERTFGDVPSQDTFTLIDLKTKKKSARYSKNVGQELFEVDSDSFERSTFMPQLYQETSLNTSSIQAKLSNLVEDTSDVNNFDKAISALRAKRTSIRQYRGTAGSVDNAQAQVIKLTNELEQIDKDKKRLSDLLQEHHEQKLLLEKKQNELRDIRTRITTTSEAIATTSHIREFKELKKTQDKLTHQITLLQKKYPKGLPSLVDIEELETSSREYDALCASEVDDHSTKDISDVVNKFQKKFENGFPTDETMDMYQKKYQDYVATNTMISQLELNGTERYELSDLNSLFRVGIPTQDDLIKQKENRNLLDQLRRQQEYQVLSSTEKIEIAQLESFFEEGIPDEATLRKHQDSYQKIDELRQNNVKLIGTFQTLSAVEQPSESKRVGANSVALFVSGAVILVAGMLLLAKQMNMPGAIVLAIGLVLLLVAIYLTITTAVKREVATQVTGPQLSPETKSQIRSNEKNIQDLDAQINSFLSQYSIDSQTTSQALSTIYAKREKLLSLQEKLGEFKELSELVNDQCMSLEQELTDFLSPYFDHLTRDYSELDVLGDKLITFNRLTQQEAEQNKRKESLKSQADKIEKEIIDFIGTYYLDSVSPDQFGSLIPDLGRDCTLYKQATQNLLKINKAKQARNSKKEDLLAYITRILDEFGVHSLPPFSMIIRDLRDATLEESKIVPAINENKELMDAFLEKYGDLSNEQVPDVIDGLDSLKKEENFTTKEIDGISKEIINRELIIDKIQTNIDLFPIIEDDLDRWKQKRDLDEQNCSLLDETLEFLTDAKDNLSDNYINEIEGSFTQYAKELLSMELGEFLLSPNLDIQLQRYGEAKELSYFSVGYTNAIMLSMRLALIDALYKKEKPMIILDDPFVNLDDEHTEKALSLLHKLAESKQILYLVCNSSRC